MNALEKIKKTIAEYIAGISEQEMVMYKLMVRYLFTMLAYIMTVVTILVTIIKMLSGEYAMVTMLVLVIIVFLAVPSYFMALDKMEEEGANKKRRS